MSSWPSASALAAIDDAEAHQKRAADRERRKAEAAIATAPGKTRAPIRKLPT